MTSSRFLNAISILMLVAVYASAQQAAPRGLTLLPGFNHEMSQGIDSASGRIWKEGGLSISYTLGASPGKALDLSPRNVLWTKEQVLRGHQIRVSLTQDQKLAVVFPPKFRPVSPNTAEVFTGTSAYFYADVKSDEDVADMLLMVLAYEPPPMPGQ